MNKQAIQNVTAEYLLPLVIITQAASFFWTLQQPLTPQAQETGAHCWCWATPRTQIAAVTQDFYHVFSSLFPVKVILRSVIIFPLIYLQFPIYEVI